MRFSPLVPINSLESVASLSDFHLCLIHLMQESIEYANFYRERVLKGDFVILDNSACELGSSVSIEEIKHWYTYLEGPAVVVLPDTQEGCNVQFLRESKEHLDYFFEVNPFVKIMAVPHTLKELEYISSLSFIDIIGLNRTLEEYGRLNIILDAIELNLDKKFHILGMIKDPIKEVKQFNTVTNMIIGIDSALPFRILSMGRTLNEPRPYPPPMDDFQEELEEPFLSFVKSNMQKFLKFVGKLS